MKKNQTSLTAMGIAVARAVESEKTASERICFDPYAAQMLPAWFYRMSRFFIRSGYAEMRGKGVNGYLVARDRYIDDELLRCLDTGIQQLVILGAGYDSRAYRFPGLAGAVRVFEVDHPATQADKLERVKKIFGCLPEWVTYVPVDFTQQTLNARLLESGYDPALKTLFIWQGVVMYLTLEEVDGTLNFIRKESAPGSTVVFDYLYRSILEGEKGHGEIAGMRRYRGMTGEPLKFGLERGQVQAFMQSRGFQGVRWVDSEDLKQLYFSGVNAGRAVVSGYGIVTAHVP